MNPNYEQALDDEEAGLEQEEEDIDYDAVYGGIDVDMTPPEKTEEMQKNYARIFGENALDYGKQAAKETLIGVGGTYGDLQELIGLGKDKSFTKLSKIERSEGNPSYADIESLSEDSIVPQNYKLPTSEQLRTISDAIGGPGEPETPAGKYGRRTGKLYGTGLAFGQVNPVSAVVAGTAGQAAEDAGADPLLQTAIEVVALLATGGKSGKNLIESSKKEIQQKISDLRKLGYTEEEITLAINSANKGGKAAKIASKGSKTEEAFENFATKSDDLISGILEEQIPGIEKGTKHIHEMAADAYGQVVQDASKLNITKLDPFFDSMHTAMKDIKKSIGHNPEAKKFVEELTAHTLDIISNPTADNMIDFYKRLNGLGKWVGRNQKDRIINNVKDSIKNTFKSEGKAGQKLAENFEKVNSGIQKAYKAEDLMGLVEKARTQEGLDFNKFNKIFDKKENIALFEEVLGTTQAKNIQLISKTGKEIKNFDKAWKNANNFKVGTGADIARGTLGSYYFYKGDWEGLTKVIASKGATTIIKKLAEQSLTNPRFQNLLIKGLHAIKTESPKLMRAADEGMRRYLEDEGIDIDLD